MGEYLEVRLDQLAQNPDNPRETLGDLDDLAAVDMSVMRERRAAAYAESVRLRAELEPDDDMLTDAEASALCRAARGGGPPIEPDRPAQRSDLLHSDNVLRAQVRRGLVNAYKL